MESDCIRERLKKLSDFKNSLKELSDKLMFITNDLNWDYEKLTNEAPSDLVICSINNQHRVPSSKIKSHELKCAWHQNGYSDDDKPFSEYSGCGSAITVTPDLIETITSNASSSSSAKDIPRSVPETSAKLDQNFSREEKLALYDYVIANTQQQKSYSDLYLQSSGKKEEKKEMTRWEVAAALRDAKRRRASYRNKVHTNRKTHTEIMREVIEVQMEALKEEIKSDSNDSEKRHKKKKHKHHKKKEKHDKSEKHSKRRSRSKDDYYSKDNRKNHDGNHKHKDRSHKRSPSGAGSDSNSRSRSHDKHRKWKSSEGRSHSHKTSKCRNVRQG